MANPSRTLALVTSSEFKWTAEIQYKESLENRDEAIRYASQHGCNLIVKYEKRSGPQFDVMLDPNPSWTVAADCQVVEAAPLSKGTEGWRKRGLLGMFGFAKRIDAAAPSAAQH